MFDRCDRLWSHASQRDDFECSVPEVDRLVARGVAERVVDA